jgi:disulfide bond formation protein DsbB
MIKTALPKLLLYFSWFVALSGMLGSLYYSEIEKFAPCVLCWYQRIFLYPLVFILPVGIIRKDKMIHTYIFPLVLAGLVIAFYHVLLIQGIIPHKIAPCQIGVSCSEKYINYFGFITIPFLSFLAFATITGCMVIYDRLTRKIN